MRKLWWITLQTVPGLSFGVLLALLALVELYRGFAINSAFFAPAQALGGLSLAFLSLVFIDLEGFHPVRFMTFQSLFLLGGLLVIPFFQKSTPFTTTDSFLVGSFALIVTGSFLHAGDRRFDNLLQYSLTATVVLFASGLLSAFADVVQVATQPSGSQAGTQYVISSLFLLGAMDLLLLSFLLALVFVSRVRTRPTRDFADDYIRASRLR